MKVERSKMADIPIGAVAAAIIGAGASLISLIITKQNKTSEFRQAWVDALRTDIAEGIAAVSLLLALFKQPLDNERKLSGKLFEAWSRTKVALARVQLRLNMAEDDHANFAA
jgi:hypothetical protein